MDVSRSEDLVEDNQTSEGGPAEGVRGGKGVKVRLSSRRGLCLACSENILMRLCSNCWVQRRWGESSDWPEMLEVGMRRQK